MARTLFEQRPENNQFTNSEVIKVIKSVPDLLSSPQRFRDQLLTCGILINAGLTPDGKSQFSFLHRTFLEYLTACSLARQANSEGWERIKAFIDKKTWHPAWQEVIVLLAGQLDDPIPLLEVLADKKKDDLFRHRLTLAALCMPELSSEKGNTHSNIVDSIATKALGSLRNEATTSNILDRLNRLLGKLDLKKEVHEIALETIESIGSVAATRTIFIRLFNLLRDPDHNMQKAALTIIRSFEHGLAETEFLDFLAYLLGGETNKNSEILNRLVELLYDEDWYVRKEAVQTSAYLLMMQGVRIFKVGDGKYEGRTVEELSRIDACSERSRKD